MPGIKRRSTFFIHIISCTNVALWLIIEKFAYVGENSEI